MANKYCIPGYFDNCVVKGDQVVENKFFGKTVFVYKNHSLKEPGVLGKTVLIFKRDGIYEPGLLGKRLFNVTKYGEVKETGIFGRSVGAIPTNWIADAPVASQTQAQTEYDSSNQEAYVKAQYDRETKELKEELDQSLGYVADVTNTRENAKKITVPDKYTKFTLVAPYLIRNGLETIVIHKNVNTIAAHSIGCSKAFVVDEENKKYCSENGILYSKDKTAILRVPSNIDFSTFVIPSTVTLIGKRAFSGCNIENLIIPASVTTIEEGAFSSCKSLKNIFVPISVTKIGVDAFQFDKKVVINAETDSKPLGWENDFSENKAVNWNAKAHC